VIGLPLVMPSFLLSGDNDNRWQTAFAISAQLFPIGFAGVLVVANLLMGVLVRK
jgi:hypothetical protein